MTDPIATLVPSMPRRVMATAALAAIAGLLLWIAVAHPPASIGWQVFALLMGVAFLWVTVRLWNATAQRLVLTDDGLFDGDGACLARIDDIEGVERGVFAFKPSNGFTIRLKTPGQRGWAPGLWWRFGRRLGVGGVTPAAQGKYMAEMLSMALVSPKT